VTRFQSVLVDRAAGTLLGAAAGDALGAPFEGGQPPTELIEMNGGGPAGWAPGEWTDDTCMTICIAEVAAAGMDLRSTEALSAIGDRFLNWYWHGSPGIGRTTQSVLASALTGVDLPVAAVAYQARTGGSASNGALMRTAPVALAHLGDDEAMVEAAIAVAGLTHADPLAGQSCAIWCIAIDRAIREDRLDGAWDALKRLPASARDRWSKSLHEATEGPPAAFQKNWHAVGCLQAALAAVLQGHRSLEDGLRAAVTAGGDTDTVGTVAGALLGARWGVAAVPNRWRSSLHDRFGHSGDDLVQLGYDIIQAKLRRIGPFPRRDDLD
jgi:ADP-ribosyl-[dinitrogen reductase] hydrolase